MYLVTPADEGLTYLDCRPKSMPTAATQPAFVCAKKAATTAPAEKSSRQDRVPCKISEQRKELPTAH
jgi:hypothetical protein